VNKTVKVISYVTRKKWEGKIKDIFIEKNHKTIIFENDDEIIAHKDFIFYLDII
jgi:hypothetical protein